jgi:hypothetical protein
MNWLSLVNLSLYQKSKTMLFELSTAKLIALGLMLLFVANLPSAIAVALMPDYQLGRPGFNKQSPLRMILWGCVIAPLLETLISQTCKIQFVREGRRVARVPRYQLVVAGER